MTYRDSFHCIVNICLSIYSSKRSLVNGILNSFLTIYTTYKLFQPSDMLLQQEIYTDCTLQPTRKMH